MVKANASKFLKDGDKVKVSLRFSEEKETVLTLVRLLCKIC